VAATLLILFAPCLGAAPEVEPAHSGNVLYGAILKGETTIDGRRIEFPAPVLRDDQDAAAQRAALKGVVGSEGELKEFLRDSVAAPFILRARDEKTERGDIIRRADLWFAVRADLGQIDPDAVLGRAGKDDRPIEAGNMEFRARILSPDDLAARSIEVTRPVKERIEKSTHIVGKLLDRIEVEATDRAIATRSARSWVVASRTDRKFDDDKAFPNRWRAIDGSKAKADAAHPYAGGAGYVKVGALHEPAGVLVVEAHFAFAEPRAWFDGAPILRSKFSLVAQDQIRRLRRELAGRKISSDWRRLPSYKVGHLLWYDRGFLRDARPLLLSPGPGRFAGLRNGY
jgi:hypothetical protein